MPGPVVNVPANRYPLVVVTFEDTWLPGKILLQANQHFVGRSSSVYDGTTMEYAHFIGRNQGKHFLRYTGARAHVIEPSGYPLQLYGLRRTFVRPIAPGHGFVAVGLPDKVVDYILGLYLIYTFALYGPIVRPAQLMPDEIQEGYNILVNYLTDNYPVIEGGAVDE